MIAQEEATSDLIFLSYASPDRPRVMEIYAELKNAGYNVWIDRKEILPGEKWDVSIKRALHESVIVVVFVSSNSIDRRGYLQREIESALDNVKERLEDDIYLIPVKLDDVEAPRSLSEFHFIETWDVEFLDRLQAAIDRQFERLSLTTTKKEANTGIKVSRTFVRDEYDGLPGYTFSAEVPLLSSEIYPRISDVTEILQGWAKRSLFRQREEVFGPSGGSQGPPYFTFGQSRSLRTNSWEAYCAEPYVNGKLLSILYEIYWYGAGAAHGNRSFAAFNYFLDPLVSISSISDIFSYSSSALEFLQERCLSKFVSESGDSDSVKLDRDWVKDGTTDWNCFENYVFGKERIEFFFPPYQIGTYAAGSHELGIPYTEVKEFLTPMIRDGLANYLGDPLPVFEGAEEIPKT
ncbi:TIR domain-containing protein [Qipengyuania spongiae]|uniref:TIR domain-containing protein n=1 Tax=Qipengyuania spongiae TaxID=2909673 RepID=A0ABY5SUF0_9SPHN|nr:TIR domain-containing protein [Qipengyuania spongiae]UVI38177.1 TIR domain-containing protein [Qipengyuania spongiae]